MNVLVVGLAVGVSLRLTPLHLPAPVSPRTAVITASESSLEVVDVDGDRITFKAEGGALKMFVGEEVWCEAVESLEYATSNGAMRQDYGVGNFELSEVNRADQAAALEKLAVASGVDWTEWVELPELDDLDEEEDGDGGAWMEEQYGSMDVLLKAAEGIVMPPEVEKMLEIDEELIESKPAARVLWSRLLAIYPSEAAAVEAVQRNSALIYPYLNKPAFIDGSWEVLKTMMTEEEALEVVVKNPGILCSNPGLLATSDADTVKRAAGLVDGVETFMDATIRKLWR